MLGLDDQRATYRAGRATLCAGPDDLERYDQVFDAYFGARDGLPAAATVRATAGAASPGCPRPRTAAATATSAEEVVRAMASATEVLRHRDVAALTAAEKQRLAAHVRDPAAAAAAAAYRPAPALAPRRRRRVPHAARQPAPDGRARPTSPGGAAAPGRAGWCCWSTCPAR